MTANIVILPSKSLNNRQFSRKRPKIKQLFPLKIKQNPQLCQCRIALYSHDTMGLGHKRRNQLIAQTLGMSEISADILMISGMGDGNQFYPSSRIDYLTLPALHKSTEGQYQARRFAMSLEDIIKMRSQIILTTVQNFQPDVLIVDNVPRGAMNELNSTLKYLRHYTNTRCILGLRDILDEPEVIKNYWQKNNHEDAIREYYDQVWIYGDANIYNAIEKYAFSPDIVNKFRYTGYLNQIDRLKFAQQSESNPHFNLPSKPFALCMVGGGQDGGDLALAFAQSTLPHNTHGIILTGPMMPSAIRQQIKNYVDKRSDLQMWEYINEPTILLEKADWVVSMGGYNSTCEILSFQKKALIVPRIQPRKEQLIRTQILQELGLVDMLHPTELNADSLSKWFQQKTNHHQLKAKVDLGGLTRIPQFLAEILKGC